MIHDEKTVEIEIPWAKKSENTHESSETTKMAIPANIKSNVSSQAKELALKNWIQDLDMNSPWVARLLAVLAVLLLSMLIL